MSSDVLERMTDTSKYTGSHKLRFDESGKGRGLEGRDSVAKGKGMTAGSVASQTPYVSGYKHEGTYDSPDSSPKTSPRVTKGKVYTHVCNYDIHFVICKLLKYSDNLRSNSLIFIALLPATYIQWFVRTWMF